MFQSATVGIDGVWFVKTGCEEDFEDFGLSCNDEGCTKAFFGVRGCIRCCDTKRCNVFATDPDSYSKAASVMASITSLIIGLLVTKVLQ